MRDFSYPIMEEIKERWSPRAFSKEKISLDQVLMVLEAARYAPSCFNEQPWRFVIAEKEEELSEMRKLLHESNRAWADNAPVLVAIITYIKFSESQKNNFWAFFDAGTAWGYLSLEAQRNGLITHAMGGFDRKRAKEILQLDEDFEVIAIVAVGKLGNKGELPQYLEQREQPGNRKPLDQLLIPFYPLEREIE